MWLGGVAERARAAIGLRGRIVAVVLITTVATLGIAAGLLLGPLENSLRSTEEKALRSSVPARVVHRFERLPLGTIEAGPLAAQSRRQVEHAIRTLQRETGGAFVTVVGNASRDGTGAQQVPWAPDAQAGYNLPEDTFADTAVSFRRPYPSKYRVITIGGSEYASAVIPFVVAEPIIPGTQAEASTTPAVSANNQVQGATGTAGPRVKLRYAIVVRKSISTVPAAVHAITRAFLEAAVAGLVLTMILGIGLSGRLVARLRRLRRTAVQIQEQGSAPIPVDRTRDEVGDLARSLASMQERLLQQEEARRAFVATASHELRTPLTSLDGMLELLDDDLGYRDPDLDDARDLVARARAQSRRLGRLAAELLDLSRIDAQVELRSEPVELVELSRAVLAEFDVSAAERGVETVLETRDPAAWALGDPGAIARILRILVDNALRVSPRDSVIRVRLRRGRVVGLSVCDEGPGVCEEDREAVFQRFKRGRDTSGKAGFGLGLAIGRELAGRMDGKLVLEPPGPGGATFTLMLPLAPAQEQAPEGDAHAGRDGQGRAASALGGQPGRS